MNKQLGSHRKRVRSAHGAGKTCCGVRVGAGVDSQEHQRESNGPPSADAKADEDGQKEARGKTM